MKIFWEFPTVHYSFEITLKSQLFKKYIFVHTRILNFQSHVECIKIWISRSLTTADWQRWIAIATNEGTDSINCIMNYFIEDIFKNKSRTREADMLKPLGSRGDWGKYYKEIIFRTISFNYTKIAPIWT